MKLKGIIGIVPWVKGNGWFMIDFEELNKNAMEKGKELQKEQLMEQAIKNRTALLTCIKSLSVEQRSKSYTDADGNPFTVESYLNDFIWHDQHHMKQIKEVLVTT